MTPLAIRKPAASTGAPNARFSSFSRKKPMITAGMVATTTRQKIRRSPSAFGPRRNRMAVAKSSQVRQK